MSIQRRTPLKRGRKRAAFDRVAAQTFAAKARAQGCLMCGSTLDVDAHHVVRAQHVRRAAKGMGVDETRALYDLRNVVGLCRAHHQAHHAHTARVPRRLVLIACPDIEQFCSELGVLALFEHEYPEEDR